VKRIANALAWPRPQLEVRDLELALALAAAGSTAGAATALHITQSAVSRALTQAEERVGARLFERSARGVAPTAAGERLLAGAATLLSQLCELERVVAEPEVAPTHVRLVCECYTAYRWLPSALAALARRLPGLEVEIAVDHTRQPVRALERGEIDIALLTTSALPRGARGKLLERPLLSDEVVFVVAASHPLAQKKSLTRADLRAYPLITANAPPAEARWFLARAFGRSVPKLTFLRFPLTEAVMDAARAGMGVAVQSEWMASGYLDAGDLLIRRLATGPLHRPWRIAYRREAASAAERLASVLSSSAPRLRAGSKASVGVSV
jgi:LysR family transcriptional regulator for metE and metH